MENQVYSESIGLHRVSGIALAYSSAGRLTGQKPYWNTVWERIGANISSFYYQVGIMHRKKYWTLLPPFLVIAIFLVYYLTQKLKHFTAVYYTWIYIEKKINQKKSIILLKLAKKPFVYKGLLYSVTFLKRAPNS